MALAAEEERRSRQRRRSRQPQEICCYKDDLKRLISTSNTAALSIWHTNESSIHSTLELQLHSQRMHRKSKRRRANRFSLENKVSVKNLYRILILLIFSSWICAEEVEQKLRRQPSKHGSQTPDSPVSTYPAASHSLSDVELEFWNWCTTEMGMESVLEIQTFYYYDYISAMKDKIDIFCEDCNDIDEDDSDDDEDEDFDDDAWLFEDTDRFKSVSDYPRIPVRGLAASQDIQVGTLLLRIPHTALWTVETCIDQDPILSTVVGPAVREAHGWDSKLDEVPFLALALLYHRSLGKDSPYHAYLSLLLDETTKGQMEGLPHRWTSTQLRHWAPLGVRKVAKGIQKDVQVLYKRIIMPLLEENSDVFGNPIDTLRSYYADEEELDNGDADDVDSVPIRDDDYPVIDETSKEWMFSLEHFHWAFALVNSRHWHLKLPEHSMAARKETDERGLQETEAKDKDVTTDDEEAPSTDPNDESQESSHFSEQAAPPAAMPTDEWLDLQRQEQHKEDEETAGTVNSNHMNSMEDDWTAGNSFLAPLADLLNFGPPCTRGIYNSTTETFDIVATCPFQKGQEVTFWYTDACQDVFLANYGFTEPTMVPTCSEEKDEKIALLQQELLYAWEDLDKVDSELLSVVEVLRECHCDADHAHLAGIFEKMAPPSDKGPAGVFDTSPHKTEVQTPSPPDEDSKDGDKSPSPRIPNGSHLARHAIRGANRPMTTRSPKSGDGRSRPRASRKSDL